MGMLLHASRLLDWEKRAKSFKQKCLTLQGISLAAMAAALLLAPRSGGEIRWRCRRQEEEGVGRSGSGEGPFATENVSAGGFLKHSFRLYFSPTNLGRRVSIGRSKINAPWTVFGLPSADVAAAIHRRRPPRGRVSLDGLKPRLGAAPSPWHGTPTALGSPGELRPAASSV